MSFPRPLKDRPLPPGRIDEAWLGADDGDAWTLTTRAYDPPWHRDAFIGNGLIGQRVGPLGDGTIYDRGSACYMHGLWSEAGRDSEALLELPRWATLELRPAESLPRPHGSVENYVQTLDLRTGVAATQYTWCGADWCVDIRREIYLSRAQPNLAVLRLEFTPRGKVAVEVHDLLDASFIEQTADRCTEPGARMRLSLELGAPGRRLSIVSGVACRAAAGESFRASPCAVRRIVRIEAERDVTCTVTKAVALFADRPDGAAAADALVERALADPAGTRSEHDAAWRALWEHRIEVPVPRLRKLVNAALYQVYAQVREGVNASVGPCGLSGSGGGGRISWLADLWVYPVLALLHPGLGRCITAYRAATLGGAAANAREDGHAGACFACESARDGRERVPDPKRHHQRHVNAAVALAQWQDYLISGDEAYLRGHGARVIAESARYWAGRVTHNAAADRYELKHVYCPDELAEIRDNNAATNAGAAWTLRRAAALAEQLGIDAPVADWRRIADRMYLPWDAERGLFRAFDGWHDDRVVRQADAALMIYPYEHPMDDAVKARTVDYYRRKYPAHKVMLSAAIDGIVDAGLGRGTSAWEALLDLLPHFHLPYLVASESPDNECITFLAGLGGLLQLLVMGFAGVRLHDDALVIEPCLPAALPGLAVRGMHYAGACFDLEIGPGGEPRLANVRNGERLRAPRRDGRPVSGAPPLTDPTRR